MKRIVEVSGEGLEACLGETVMVWCANYIYSGKLVGVNTHDIALENAVVVYETGPLKDKGFSDAQELPCAQWYVRTCAIEAYGVIS